MQANTTALPFFHRRMIAMTDLIGSILLGYRTRSRFQSIRHLDERMLADIGLSRADFRSAPKKKTA